MNELWSGRGSFLEHLLTRTAQFYEANGIALFEKRSVPISFRRKAFGKGVTGQIVGRAGVDYFGVAKGVHYEFEAKQTKGDRLLMAAFQPHQLARLFQVADHGGRSFVVCYFETHEELYLVDSSFLKTKLEDKKGHVKLAEIRQKCRRLEITTPGIVDFLSLV